MSGVRGFNLKVSLCIVFYYRYISVRIKITCRPVPDDLNIFSLKNRGIFQFNRWEILIQNLAKNKFV